MSAAMTLGLVAAPAFGAGFSIFEQGTTAMGMAGAFTAQADDGSAMFHNVAGLAFQKEGSFTIGTTLIAIGDSEFQGESPFPGPSATGQQEDQIVTPSHIYWVKPLTGNLTFGVGYSNPFGLVSEWQDPDNWSGRFLATRSELVTHDLNPSIGWQVNPTFAVGFGAIIRFSEIELDRRVAQQNPFILGNSEVAAVNLSSDLNEGFGWNIGILHKYNNSFQWGLSYRSKIELDYAGDGRFTQRLTGFPQFDALVAQAIPFGQNLPIEATLEFPDMASLGFAFALAPNAWLETDFNWTGWSTFDTVDINFTQDPQFNQQLEENWDDAYNYRVGLRLRTSPSREWRVGYVYDETPQAAEQMSPLLPDADRNGFTIGYGHSGSFDLDVALMYLPFDDRTSNPNVDNFNGTYKSTAWLLGLTATF